MGRCLNPGHSLKAFTYTCDNFFIQNETYSSLPKTGKTGPDLDFSSYLAATLCSAEEIARRELRKRDADARPRTPGRQDRRPFPLPIVPLAEFKSSGSLLNSQLVCPRPVGLLDNFMFNLNYLFQLYLTPLSFVIYFTFFSVFPLHLPSPREPLCCGGESTVYSP